jgi:hypothetical protein
MQAYQHYLHHHQQLQQQQQQQEMGVLLVQVVCSPQN